MSILLVTKSLKVMKIYKIGDTITTEVVVREGVECVVVRLAKGLQWSLQR